MRCLSSDASGVLSLMPEGSACPPEGLAVLSVAEAQAVINGPFSLTPQQGGQILAAVLLVWGVGFVIRSLIQAVRMRSDGVEYEQ